jgi:hypothetical protein
MNFRQTQRQAAHACFAAVLSLASTAQAQSALFKACGADLRQHCNTVAPGGGRVLACLQAHEAELSASCQAVLPQLAQCRLETQRLCGDVSPREMRRCFEAQREQFSAECRNLTPSR